MEGGPTQAVVRLVFQLFIILTVAKVGSELFERYLRQPGVLGELLMGIAIGPFALGGLLVLPQLGPLFPGSGDFIPLSTELYALAQIAAVILLFHAGLETDLNTFIRYAGASGMVALGGVVFPFLLGDLATFLLGYAESPLHPSALFMGAVLTATSVGITARVLEDIGRLNTPEGVTILGGAVIDDVLGILVLALVVAMAERGEFSLSSLGWIALKAVGFWAVLMAVAIATSRRVASFLKSFKTPGATTALALGLCFLAAALSEFFGLAMIIGAYAMGLALSRTEAAGPVLHGLEGIYRVFVPIFFVVMGMLVNLRAVEGVLAFGLIITGLAIIGKLGGCSLASLTVGFNKLGAARIGIGMLPRGEVALIVAGMGLAYRAITLEEFGVAVMMTFITTVMAPILLVPAFKVARSGRRGGR